MKNHHFTLARVILVFASMYYFAHASCTNSTEDNCDEIMPKSEHQREFEGRMPICYLTMINKAYDELIKKYPSVRERADLEILFGYDGSFYIISFSPFDDSDDLFTPPGFTAIFDKITMELKDSYLTKRRRKLGSKPGAIEPEEEEDER